MSGGNCPWHMLAPRQCPGIGGEGAAFLEQSCARDFSRYLIALKIKFQHLCHCKTWNHLVLRRCTVSSVLQLYHVQDLGQAPWCCSGAVWLSEVVSREQLLVQGMILSLFKLSELNEPSLKFSHTYNNCKADSLDTLCFSTSW